MSLKKFVIMAVFMSLVVGVQSSGAFVLSNSRPQAVEGGITVNSGPGFNVEDSRWTLDRPSVYSYHSRHIYNSRTPRFVNTSSKFFSNGFFGRLQTHDTYGDSTLDPVETPEPASLILFGAGLAGVGLYRRFKK